MARKEQRNNKEDKKNKKRTFGQKAAAGVKTTITTKVKVKTEAKAAAPGRQSGSRQLIGKKPWARLIEIRPGRTHPGQANASARKKWRRRHGPEGKFIKETFSESEVDSVGGFAVRYKGGELHRFATQKEASAFLAAEEAREYPAM